MASTQRPLARSRERCFCAEAGPVGERKDLGAVAAYALGGVVAALGVDDDPRVGECHRSQAGIDARRFVFGDDDDRKQGGGHASAWKAKAL